MKVVHIDDSKFSTRVTANLLKKVFESIEIVSMNDEDAFMEFLESSEAADVDVFMVDLLLLKIPGDEIVKKLREKYPDVFIAVLSSNVQDEVKEKLYNYGIDVFIEKPLTFEKLKDMEARYSAKRIR